MLRASTQMSLCKNIRIETVAIAAAVMPGNAKTLAQDFGYEFWLRVRVTCENSHNFMTSQTVLSPQVHQVMVDHATNGIFHAAP